MSNTTTQQTDKDGALPFHARGPRSDSVIKRRYELKYRIDEATAHLVQSYISSYIPLDKYSVGVPNNAYMISSLYLDSPDYALCKETLEGKVKRCKLRIRCYDDKPDSPCFFEVKRRLNMVIMKDRAYANKMKVESILRNGHAGGGPASNSKDLRQFLLYTYSYHARPKVLVRYMRQAYESTDINRLRITFDRELAFKPTDRCEVTTGGHGWQRVPINFVVLEIKFTDNYPRWVSDMTKDLNLQYSSMSKYCSSVLSSNFMGADPYEL